MYIVVPVVQVAAPFTFNAKGMVTGMSDGGWVFTPDDRCHLRPVPDY